MSSPNLAEVLGKINDGICVLSACRQVSFINEKASQIFEAADEIFNNRIDQAISDRTPARFEHFHNALQRWYEHRTYPNADGGLTLISSDITSRHRMEEALRSSEERFRRVIESNIIGVIVVENGAITEANDIFLDMICYSRSDLVRRQLRWRQLTPPEFDGHDAKARQELESAGVFSPYEKEFFRKDGSRVPVFIGGVATQARDKMHETLCLAMDLSARRRAEERLRSIVEVGKILASSLEYEKTFPEAAEFIASTVASSCAIFVQEEGRLVRMASAHTMPISGEAELHTALNRVMTTGISQIVNGWPSHVLVPIPMRNEISGVLVAALAKPATFDVEDVHFFEVFGHRAGLALESARLYSEAQRANRLKDEFVAVISHELRTPLTPILGGVYMMRQEPHDRDIAERALNLIERNAKTQVKIVDDLLDVSRALSGKLRLTMEPVDLSHVIHAATETVRPATEAKRIHIEVRLAGLSGIVSGDPDRLQQVIWNLLANSVKFTPNDGHIVVELAESHGYAEIRVTDTGIGIEPAFLPHVFEKFRQADTSRTRPHGGLGLGLAIVRHLVESHGGTVHAESPGEEQGATFVVNLPLRPAARIATGGSKA
jgi:PAS domain S-box-containing protein